MLSKRLIYRGVKLILIKCDTKKNKKKKERSRNLNSAPSGPSKKKERSRKLNSAPSARFIIPRARAVPELSTHYDESILSKFVIPVAICNKRFQTRFHRSVFFIFLCISRGSSGLPHVPWNYPAEIITPQAGVIFDERPLTFNLRLFQADTSLCEFILIFFEKSVRALPLHASGHFVKGFWFVVAVGNLYHRKTINDIFTYVNANGRSCLTVKGVQFFQSLRVLHLKRQRLYWYGEWLCYSASRENWKTNTI